MVEVTCKFTGLKFEWENRRKQVHPEIARYTGHKDPEVRRKAKAAIEYGCQQGWQTVDRFIEEIDRAIAAPDEPEEDQELDSSDRSKYREIVLKEGYHGGKPWVARIVGPHSVFQLDRVWLHACDKNKRRYTYRIPLENEGEVYETCNRSNKGNQCRGYYQVQDGDLVELTFDRVCEIFQVPSKEDLQPKEKRSWLDFVTDDPESAVEECLECGALYSKPGFVEAGGMGCRRCNF